MPPARRSSARRSPALAGLALLAAAVPACWLATGRSMFTTWPDPAIDAMAPGVLLARFDATPAAEPAGAFAPTRFALGLLPAPAPASWISVATLLPALALGGVLLSREMA